MTTAVILAAGAGTRLGELGRRYSKPMLPIAGRPLIDWVIGALHAAGAARFVVVGHVSDAALASFVGVRHPEASFVTQSVRRGIADALRMALPLVATEPAYLACACDSLFEPDDIEQLIRLGQRHAGAAVIGVLDMGTDATASRSAVQLDGNRVIEIIEKPAVGRATSGLVAMPVYWLPQSAASVIENAVPVGAECYISTALNAFIAAGETVLATRMRDRLEITTAEDVRRAAAHLRRRAAHGVIQ